MSLIATMVNFMNISNCINMFHSILTNIRTDLVGSPLLTQTSSNDLYAEIERMLAINENTPNIIWNQLLDTNLQNLRNYYTQFNIFIETISKLNAHINNNIDANAFFADLKMVSERISIDTSDIQIQNPNLYFLCEYIINNLTYKMQQGFQGFQGVQGVQGFQVQQGFQGFQGVQGTQQATSRKRRRTATANEDNLNGNNRIKKVSGGNIIRKLVKPTRRLNKKPKSKKTRRLHYSH